MAAAEDPAADSWETADLEKSVSRLLINDKGTTTITSNTTAVTASLADDDGFGNVASSSGGGANSAASSATPASRKVTEDELALVDQFLREAVQKPRERLSILRMEQDVERFLRDPSRQELEFKALPTSYLRLAAHRIAQHYFLQSVAIPDNSLPDGTGSLIVLHKTSHCRFPAVRLADIPVNLPQEENTSVKFAIKQRPQKRPQAIGTGNLHSSGTNLQKSVEERKEEYNRARARIFSSSSSSRCTTPNSEAEIRLPDSFPLCSPVSAMEEKNTADGTEISYPRGSGDSSIDTSRSSRNVTEKQTVVSRNRTSNTVAVFRDRDVDRKDPDYDRNYDRYMQRFAPGFGFNGGPYTMQALYSPTVNYNSEFPQLGSSHRPQISLEDHPRPAAPHLRTPWSVASGPTPIGYGHPESLMTPFSPSHVGSRQTSSIYLQSHYSVPRPGMAYINPHEHVQPFGQAHQQQPESSFGLARPR